MSVEDTPIFFHMDSRHDHKDNKPLNKPFPACLVLYRIFAESIRFHHKKFENDTEILRKLRNSLKCNDICVPQLEKDKFGRRIERSGLYSLLFVEMVLYTPPIITDDNYFTQYANYFNKSFCEQYRESIDQFEMHVIVSTPFWSKQDGKKLGADSNRTKPLDDSNDGEKLEDAIDSLLYLKRGWS